tara:strand:- start:203 stop:685 length:483 start_codon:yes stop_codon:yes gene_type:complete
MKTKIYDIVSICLICFVLGLGRSFLLQDINIIKTTPKNIESISERLTEPALVGLDLAKKLFQEGALFIDARENSMYLEGHIKDAINIPWESSENNMIDEKLIGINYDRDIVIYCSGGDCTLSFDLGDYIFNELSFERVFIFEGGYPLWAESNLPIANIVE